jgi:RNA recognition motif-containing protein
MADATDEPLSTGSAAEPEPEPPAASSEENEQPQPPPARGGRLAPGAKGQRVYVGNLSWSTSWQDLKVRVHLFSVCTCAGAPAAADAKAALRSQDHMRTAGTVNFCNVMGANGRSKGCGLVEFATPEEAQTAIRTLHDSELDGRKIFCREDREVSQHCVQLFMAKQSHTTILGLGSLASNTCCSLRCFDMT